MERICQQQGGVDFFFYKHSRTAVVTTRPASPLGFGGDSHEFCLRPADLLPHKIGFFLQDCQSFL